jgi:hypothetical protein
MSESPPPFFGDPVSACLAIDEQDPGFTGPDRLARESAVHTITADDAGLSRTLGRAWRSGAPGEVLSEKLADYATALDLSNDTVEAIENASRFYAVVPTDAEQLLALMSALAEPVKASVYAALVEAAQEEEVCVCPACIARVAGLN